jgi:hypothetical protein
MRGQLNHRYRVTPSHEQHVLQRHPQNFANEGNGQKAASISDQQAAEK